MKKLVLILTLPLFLFGVELQSDYDISFGIFGSLGKAKTYINRDNKKYNIKVEAYAQGFAKYLSNYRKETYESKGIVKDNLLYPLEYTKTKSTYSYTKIKKYTFDHKNKKVILEKNDFLKDTNTTTSSTEVYEFYAQNDILSLYFNIINLIKDEDKENLVFHAIGAKKNNGRVDIIKPNDEDLIDIKNLMEIDTDNFLRVRINQDIFSSSDGEMIINVDQNNICNKVILKDVLLFGDIIGKKIN
ncbi:MAG: DUF3108 domain-containing protein [Campylobacterota bacterium]|nr:DUF3108 domain-containing protein [Campylobacterota bacterium]